MYAHDLFDANTLQDVLGWRVTLIKVLPNQPYVARFFPRIIQSLRFHYIGRALPCSGEGCPACYAGVGSRPVHYLFTKDRRDPRHYGMIEIGDSTMARLQELAADLPGTLNWVKAKLSRKAPNKPVLVDSVEPAEDQTGSFTPKLTMELLARFYELPMPLSDHLETWKDQIRGTLEKRLTAAVRSL